MEESKDQYELKNIDLLQSHFFPQYTIIGDVRKQEQMNKELGSSDLVVLLAAQHRDDVTPTSLYYDTNVGEIKVTLQAMEKNGIKRLVFFSSVAVYGLNKKNPNEEYLADPFNHYGKSKWQAEQVLQEWYKRHQDWNIDIIRPTVIFGERNRGNVYNLLHKGHVELYRRAKGLGDYLIVAAQDSDYILKYKPNAKVLDSTDDRKYMIKSIRYVDEVITYTDVDEIIKNVDFDVFVTGSDQCHAGFQRAISWCEEHGKEHVVLARTDGVSSSELKAKIASKIGK